MKTKLQKTKELEQSRTLLTGSRTVVFADFTGVNIEAIKRLKRAIKEAGATFKVIKKRLLKIALKNGGVDFDPTQFEAQVGTIFIPGELTSAAAPIYKFSKELAKEKKEFKVLGAYDVAGKIFLTAEQFIAIAKLPSREVLLGQLASVLTGPIRAFMYVLTEMSKKLSSAKASEGEEKKVVAG